jgi:hypothetical protein
MGTKQHPGCVARDRQYSKPSPTQHAPASGSRAAGCPRSARQPAVGRPDAPGRVAGTPVALRFPPGRATRVNSGEYADGHAANSTSTGEPAPSLTACRRHRGHRFVHQICSPHRPTPAHAARRQAAVDVRAGAEPNPRDSYAASADEPRSVRTQRKPSELPPVERVSRPAA